MLAAKGLVDTRPRRGTIVLPETQWNLADPDILDWLLHRESVLPLILEFAEVRLAIEPAAAGLAARVADDAAIAELENAIAGMRDASLGHVDPLDADIAFHIAVLRAGRNRFFYSLRFMIEVALRFSIRLSNSSKGVTLASADDHARILDAIAARDAIAAESAMRALIQESKDLLTGCRDRSALRRRRRAWPEFVPQGRVVAARGCADDDPFGGGARVRVRVRQQGRFEPGVGKHLVLEVITFGQHGAV